MWSIWLWVFPSGGVQVYLRIFRCSYIHFFYVAKVAILTPLSLLSWCSLSFPVVCLKIYYRPNFVFKSRNSIFKRYLGKWLKKKPALIPHKNYLFESSLFSSRVAACTFRTMILHQRPLRTVYDTPICNKLYSLNCWYNSVCKRNPVGNYHFRFLL